jgi:hypothetical protein
MRFASNGTAVSNALHHRAASTFQDFVRRNRRAMTQASAAVTEAARALVPTPAESHDTASVNNVNASNGF